MNCHVLSAYYVLGCTVLSNLHIILTHPPATPAGGAILSLILWMRKPRLREIKELSLEGT